MATKKLIRFDWAIKKILRDKANFSILEGFLTVVLGQEVLIEEILEGGSNKNTGDDKFNQVDLLAKNRQGEYFIIEVQNNKEYDYFQRMLYGTSKVITEYIKAGQSYAHVKKVYSITVAYFDLGQGEDYVYYGNTVFRGIHRQDELRLADKQVALFDKNKVYEIYPEYWIIKADKFDDRISDKLDEWIYFLKNSELPESYTAPGLREAAKTLSTLMLSDRERISYEAYQKRLRNIASEKFTQEADFAFALREREEEGRKEGKAEGRKEGKEEGKKEGKEEGRREAKTAIALELIKNNVPDEIISHSTGLSLAEIRQLKEESGSD